MLLYYFYISYFRPRDKKFWCCHDGEYLNKLMHDYIRFQKFAFNLPKPLPVEMLDYFF